MCAIPQMETEPEYDPCWHAPDQNFCRPVIGEVRHVPRISVGSAIPPGEQRGHDEDRDDYDHHDGYGVEQELSLRVCDRAFWLKNWVRDCPAVG